MMVCMQKGIDMDVIKRILLLVCLAFALGILYGVFIGESRCSASSAQINQDEKVTTAYLEGYADALVDVMGVVSSGGGVDEVLSFARGATGRFK